MFQRRTQFHNHKFGVITLVIISLVIITSVIIYAVSIIDREGKVAINIAFAPSYATIELNGHKLKNNSINYLTAGEYQVRIYAPDFESIFSELEVNENTQIFYGALSPATQGGYDLMKGDLAPEFQKIQNLPEGKVNFPDLNPAKK